MVTLILHSNGIAAYLMVGLGVLYMSERWVWPTAKSDEATRAFWTVLVILWPIFMWGAIGAAMVRRARAPRIPTATAQKPR